MDEPGLPFGLLFVLVIVMPICVAVFLGLFALPNVTPEVFCCLRCEARFRQEAWKPFPDRCPLCGAMDWNRVPGRQAP